MRKLGLLGALILTLVFPCAANAAWQGSVPFDFSIDLQSERVSFDPFNIGLVHGEADYRHSTGWFGESTDGGGTWNTGGELAPGGENFDVAFDASGDRIWAYSLGDSIVVTRGSSTGGTSDSTVLRDFDASGVNDLKLAVNPAGDVLVGWTADGGDDGPGVAFWGAEEGAPATAQELDESCSSSAPTPVLDPDRSATFAWTCSAGGGEVFQSISADASGAGGFGPAEALGPGKIVGGGQADDGRAALLIREERTIPENSSGRTNTSVLRSASRRAGSGFGDSSDLVGDADTTVVAVSRDVLVTPGGRALVGFTTTPNHDPDHTCWSLDGPATLSTATGLIDASTGALSLATTERATGVSYAIVPSLAMGSDGRLAVAFGTTTSCSIKPSFNERILLAVDGNNFTEITNPYSGGPNLRQFTFNAKGDLFVAVKHPAWPQADFSNVYLTDVPLTPLVHPDPPEPTGTTGSTGPTDPTGSTEQPAPTGSVGTKSVPPSAVRPTLKVGPIRSAKRGKLTVTVESNAAGRFSVVARSGETIIAKAFAATRGGKRTLQLKLSRKAARHLKQAGRLKAKLIVSFTPDSGVAPAPVTKSVTFKK